ncbi:MAG: hypothetical protein ACIARR_10020 [Phycisphaerales bacterium JB059]
MNNAGTTSLTQNDNANLSDVKADLAALKQDIANLVSDSKEGAIAGVNAAGEKAQELAGSAKDACRQTHRQVSEKVSERPVTYLALAFGAGAIAAKLLSR